MALDSKGTIAAREPHGSTANEKMMFYATNVQRASVNPLALAATLLAVMAILAIQAAFALSGSLAQIHLPTVSVPSVTTVATAAKPERIVTTTPAKPLTQPQERERLVSVNGSSRSEATPSRLPGIGLTRSPPREFIAAHGDTILRAAANHNLPPELIYAVIATESGFNPAARATRSTALGVMQIKPATARMVGFSGDARLLFQPDINIEYGTAYLAKAYRLAGGDTCRAVSLYNRGLGNSRINPKYCARVHDHIARYGHVVDADASE